jgi:hypothetical protein
VRAGPDDRGALAAVDEVRSGIYGTADAEDADPDDTDTEPDGNEAVGQES